MFGCVQRYVNSIQQSSSTFLGPPETSFIQGKLWKHYDIMENEALNVSSDELTTPLSSPQTPVEHTSSRIPLVFLNRLVNNLRSPSKRSPLKTKYVHHANNAFNDISHIPMSTVVCSET